MKVNDELSFAFYCMDQFLFIYMFFNRQYNTRWKKYWFPWEILHTTKIINTKAVYQYKTIICFLIHRSKEHVVFLGKGIRRDDFITISSTQSCDLLWKNKLSNKTFLWKYDTVIFSARIYIYLQWCILCSNNFAMIFENILFRANN